MGAGGWLRSPAAPSAPRSAPPGQQPSPARLQHEALCAQRVARVGVEQRDDDLAGGGGAGWQGDEEAQGGCPGLAGGSDRGRGARATGSRPSQEPPAPQRQRTGMSAPPIDAVMWAPSTPARPATATAGSAGEGGAGRGGGLAAAVEHGGVNTQCSHHARKPPGRESRAGAHPAWRRRWRGRPGRARRRRRWRQCCRRAGPG